MTLSHWTRTTIGVALAASLVTTGCGFDTESGESSGSSSGSSDDTARPTITVVTYDSYYLDETVEKSIEDRLGVEIEISASGDGAEALSAAILTAGRPEGDVFFGVDNILLGRALADDVFVELDESLVPNLDSVPDGLQLDSSGKLVPIDVGPVCVNYDKAWFETNGITPPTTLEQLATAPYSELLVVQSPVTSTPGLVFLSATYSALGDAADDYWTSLADGGALVVGGWTEAWNEQYTVNGGDYPLVLSYASSPPAEVFYSDGELTEPASGVIEATCAEQVEFAGVLRGTENEELATKVLNEMLSVEWQESLPLSNFVYPARDDVELPEVFASFAPRPEATIPLDPTIVDENRERWIDRWREIAG